MLIEYSHSKTFLYEEYLTRADTTDLLNIHISKTIREAVGSIEDVYTNSESSLAGAVEYEGDVSHAGRQLEIISTNVPNKFESLDVIDANLVNAFHQIFVRTNETNADVSHLTMTRQKFVEDRGNVQVEMARDLVRRRMLPEALRALDRATFGQGGTSVANRGRDWLRAVICLGISGRPESVATLDLAKSEKSFLQASQQAPPHAAAQCLVGAAKAAYIHGRFADAESHLRSALAIEPSCAEANYQLARLLLHAGDRKAAEVLLGRAFDRHWSFAMRAASDALFVVNAESVARIAHTTASKIILTEIRPKLDRLSSQMDFLVKHQLPQLPISTHQSFSELTASIDNLKAEVEGNHLKAAHLAREKIPFLEMDFVNLCERYCLILTGMENKIINDAVEAIKGDGTTNVHSRPAAQTIAFAIIGMVLIAAYFSPEFSGEAGSSALESYDVLGFLSKILFVAFIIGVYAIPIFWFSARGFANRKNRRLENMIEVRKQRIAVALRSEVASVVSTVAEMASLRADHSADHSAHRLQLAELPRKSGDDPPSDRTAGSTYAGTSSAGKAVESRR